VSEEPSLLEVPAASVAAPGQQQRLRRLPLARPSRSALARQRRSGTSTFRDRAVGEAAALPAVGGEPGDEALQRLAVELA